jgi:hypothetical protein
VIAHVGGVPLEEVLLPWVSGAGAVLLMARAWLAAHRRWIFDFPRISVRKGRSSLHERQEKAESR